MSDEAPPDFNLWLACWHCGCTDIRHDEHPHAGRGPHWGATVYTMCCYECGATFPGMYSLAALQAKWNRRVNPPPPIRTVDVQVLLQACAVIRKLVVFERPADADPERWWQMYYCQMPQMKPIREALREALREPPSEG